MGHTSLCPQCLLKISAGFIFPGRCSKVIIFAAIASLVQWNARAVWRFFNWEWGTLTLVTMDSLSPKRYDVSWIGTPKYVRVCQRPEICRMAVRAVVNSLLCVAHSTLACFFVHHSIGVWLTKCSTPVTAFPVVKSRYKLASL